VFDVEFEERLGSRCGEFGEERAHALKGISQEDQRKASGGVKVGIPADKRALYTNR
jgi:hypothetical protein